VCLVDLLLEGFVRDEELSDPLAWPLLGKSGGAPPAPRPRRLPWEAERALLFLRAASVPASALHHQLTRSRLWLWMATRDAQPQP